uniref:Uncharacterized protein n=1 Tax=Setaria italica TaxID=4555 RepID=K3XTK5_SETIT
MHLQFQRTIRMGPNSQLHQIGSTSVGKLNVIRFHHMLL